MSEFTQGQKVTFTVGGKLVGATGVVVDPTPVNSRIKVQRTTADGTGGIYRPFVSSVKAV